jgi:MSHA biogenesis protein MshJ
MNALWQKLAGRFAALSKRENGLVAAEVLAVVVFGGYAVWVDPARTALAALRTQATQHQTEIAVLEGQVATLQGQMKDPDAANKIVLAEVQAQKAEVDRSLQQFDRILIPPERVPQLLRSLLARHRGLELVALKTLSPVVVSERRLVVDASGKPVASSANILRQGNVFQHGIEIKVAGSYADLLAYVSELEGASQKLMFGKMSLSVTAYPRSELTLTVYTFSLDPIWLVV